MQALRKTSSLPQPLKTLPLSLNVFDLGVGLLVESFYFGLLVRWLQRNDMLFSYYFEAKGGVFSNANDINLFLMIFPA